MLLCAHLGLTLGAVRGLSLASTALAGRNAQPGPHAEAGAPLPPNDPAGDFIDYRLILVGSMLPDLIDKPLGITFLGNGRAFAHTLLFNLILVAVGIVLCHRSKGSGFMILALSSAGHLILDAMWQNPVTLLWPLMGPLAFTEAHSLTSWLAQMVAELPRLTPGTLAAELVGAVILIAFVTRLASKKQIRAFVKSGTF